MIDLVRDLHDAALVEQAEPAVEDEKLERQADEDDEGNGADVAAQVEGGWK